MKKFSVTGFIKSYGREFDASELKKLFKFEEFVSQPLEKPKELDPTIIGTAVDHLARFYFNYDVKKSFYVAKIGLNFLSDDRDPLHIHKEGKNIGGEDWRSNYGCHHVGKIINYFYQYFDRCCKIIKRKRANPLAQCRAAYVLAIYISFYRSGIHKTPQEYFDQFDWIMNLDLKVFNPYTRNG